VELEAESTPTNRSWSPVVPVPSETVAVAMFQWKRLPLSKGVVLRYLAYAVVIVVACGGLAYAASSVGAKSYGARTEILYPLNQQNASGTFLREDRALASQQVMMTSHSVLDPVAAKFHLSYSQLASKETVSVLIDSEVLRIEVDDHSRSTAQAIVGAIATNYLKQVPDEDALTETHLNNELKSINAQLGTLTPQFNTLEEARQRSATVTNPNPAETPSELAVQSQISGLNQQVTAIQSRLDTVTVNQLQQPHVTQLTQPYLLTGPVAPKPLRAALAGALAGIMVAAIAVGVLVRRRLRRLPLDQLD